MGFLQFQRGYEREADYRAVPMMAGAGWDPEALVRYIEREQPSAYTEMAAVFSQFHRSKSESPAFEKRLAICRRETIRHPPSSPPSRLKCAA